MTNKINEIFREMEDQDRNLLVSDMNILIKALQAADARFAQVYDTIDGEWKIFIESDIENRVMELSYDQNEQFKDLGVTITNFNMLLGAYIAASFSVNQFNFIKYYRGKNVFNISGFTHNYS